MAMILDAFRAIEAIEYITEHVKNEDEHKMVVILRKSASLTDF